MKCFWRTVISINKGIINIYILRQSLNRSLEVLPTLEIYWSTPQSTPLSLQVTNKHNIKVILEKKANIHSETQLDFRPSTVPPFITQSLGLLIFGVFPNLDGAVRPIEIITKTLSRPPGLKK